MRLSLFIVFLVAGIYLFADDTMEGWAAKPKLLYGTASFYSNTFNGKKTASGEIYSHKKMTAACNVLPLGTWIKVTNLRNGKSVVVKTNDRLHKRMKRVVDLSREAADKLDYVKSGLTRVRIEVIRKKKSE